MKYFIYTYLLLWLTSCSYRTLEGRAKPVYFSADAAVFTDTSFWGRTVAYNNLMGLSYPCLEVVDLRQEEAVQVLISRPTFVQKDNMEFLVYPGENIFITTDDYIPTFSTANHNKVRDGELLVLKTFQELEKRPKIPLLYEYTFQTILNLEKELKAKIAPAERASQLVFDSLCTVFQVSRKFKRLTKDYVQNRYDGYILGLYQTYRDTLLAHNVYQSKVKTLLPEVNNLKKVKQFNFNIENYTNNLYTWLFPYSGIRNMIAEGAFQPCFDSVVANFRGPARDYLLSRIMYQACQQGFTIPASYRKQYRSYSMNKGYRKIIARAGSEYKYLKRDVTILPNELLMVDGKTKVKFEDVLAQNKDKYVLVDLWASWCMPCMEEMPALQALRKRYPEEEIAFISVSVDRSVPAWQTRLSQLHSDSLTNYLLLNQDRTALAKQIRLTAIPRYLLYDKEGKMVNANVPGPSDPGLRDMLDKFFLK